MATITRENIGLLNEKIVVKVEKDDYLPSFEKAIKEYSRKANIPGFRKGMVPVGMVKKMYGSSVFADEVIKSVEKGLSDYMSSENLKIFAQPLPLPENDSRKLDMNQPSEYAFAFEVGLKPDFAIADLGSAQLTRYIVSVTEEMISEEVEHLQTRYSNMTDLESVTSENNVLTLTFAETDAEGNELEGGVRKENSLLVKYFTPIIQEQLMGKQKSDTLLIQLSNAFNDKEREFVISDLGLSNEVAENTDKFFKLLINKVGLTEKPELDEDFFKKVYPDKNIATGEEFRNQIREEIQSQWDSQSRNQLLDQIYHELLNNSKIEFPEDFLKRWMLTGTEKQKTQEQVEEEYPTFANQLKWTLIVDKIVHENGIEVNPPDLIEFAKQQLLGYMGSSMALDMDQPWVTDYLAKMMKDKKYVEESFHRIQTDKVFAWAESQTKPAEVTISVEDFQKLLEEHKHHH